MLLYQLKSYKENPHNGGSTNGFVFRKSADLMNFFELAKRGQDFDDRPPIWLDDASVLRHQLVINLIGTSLVLMSVDVGLSKLCLFYSLISPIYLIEAKPHQDMN